jgi:flagellar basal body-associated protein FliL
MNAFAYYEDIVCEEKIVSNSFQIIITINDKKAKTSREVFNKKLPIPLAIILFIIIIPILILLLLLITIAWFFSLFNKETPEMSYQEAQAYFNSSKGYFDNLSDDDKKQLLTKRKNNPLGL